MLVSRHTGKVQAESGERDFSGVIQQVKRLRGTNIHAHTHTHICTSYRTRELSNSCLNNFGFEHWQLSDIMGNTLI